MFDELRSQLAPFRRGHRQPGRARQEPAVKPPFLLPRRGPLLAKLAEVDGLRYVHRASNLEDVFIKLTGRELRD